MENLDNPQAPEASDVTFGQSLRGDTASAIEFLKSMHAASLWGLTAIDVESGKTQTATFDAECPTRALAWIEARNGSLNLYFSVNPLRDTMSKKAKSTDVAALAYLHVDIDPRTGEDIEAERARILNLLTDNLPAGIPKPTAVVFSGGGYQAFWKLAEPLALDGSVEDAEKAKLWNLGLERKFGCADSCHNIDRIMRLPGTINVPNKKKRDKGRVPTLATLVDANWSRVYPLSSFEPSPPTTPADWPSVDKDNAELDVDPNVELVKLVDVNDLDKHTADGKPINDRVKRIIQAGSDELDDRLTSKPKDDRSRWVFEVACALVRRGVPDNILMSVLLDRDFRISEHIYDQKTDARKYAARQIKRAKERVKDPLLAELNDIHAVLLQEGGNPRKLPRYCCQPSAVRTSATLFSVTCSRGHSRLA